MWKGEGGFVFGRLQKPKIVQKEHFLKKSLRRNVVNIGVFAFCGLLPWKMQSLNSSLFMHVFSKNTVNTSVFKRRFKNTVKYSISDMLSCQSVANSGVFATCAFLGVAKTS